jgi:hypothetical protein
MAKEKLVAVIIGIFLALALIACTRVIDAVYQDVGIRIDGTYRLTDVTEKVDPNKSGNSIDNFARLYSGDQFYCTVPGYEDCYISILGFKDDYANIEVKDANGSVHNMWVTQDNLNQTLFLEPEKWISLQMISRSLIG